MRKVPLFKCTTPCSNCPYRKDAPVKHWSILEFKHLLDTEKSEFGTVYRCHKNNGSVCVGWLMDQVKRYLPSIMLRLALSKHQVSREYLDSLSSPSLFASVRAMIRANYPILLKNSKPKSNEHITRKRTRKKEKAPEKESLPST